MLVLEVRTDITITIKCNAMIMIFFQFAKSCRTGDLPTYSKPLERLMPVIATLNHPNFFRILPVHSQGAFP
jgi:hypothetical protein